MSIILSCVLLIALAVTLFIIANRVSKNSASSGTKPRHSDDEEEGVFEKNGPTIWRISGGLSFFLVLVLLLVGFSKTTDSGTVQVGKTFGKISRDALHEGLTFPVNPLTEWTPVNIQRNSIIAEDGTGAPGMMATTADNNPVNIDANFSYSINGEYAWWVMKEFGDEKKFKKELLEKAAQSATRDALGHFKLEDAQIAKRAEFEKMLTEQFLANLVSQLLPKRGELTEQEVQKVIVVYPTQLMSIVPDPKVANAIAEKKANEITLGYQETLNAIENQRAQRRKSEGTGIRNLFDELPKGYNSEDVARVLYATADKERADALFKAVTEGKVTFGVFEGSAARMNNK